VEDSTGFIGMIRPADLDAALARGSGGSTVRELLERSASAVGTDGFVHLHGDQPLGQALARMGETRRTVLPVVSRANVRILLGLVTLADILRAFGVES
jgi:CBS domain-containing protein